MSRRPVGARGALPGVAALTALFLGSLAVGLPGTPPAAGQERVPVRRLGVGFSDEGVPRLTFSARDLADRPGVLGPPQVDVRRGRVRVFYDPARTSPEAIRAWIASRQDYACTPAGRVIEVER